MSTWHVKNVGRQNRLNNFLPLHLPVVEASSVHLQRVGLLAVRDLREPEQAVQESKTGCFTRRIVH
jgi:hypothetical protein